MRAQHEPGLETKSRRERVLDDIGITAEAAVDRVEALTRNTEDDDALLDVVTSQSVVSSDASKGLGFVPDFQPLTAWDEAEQRRRAPRP